MISSSHGPGARDVASATAQAVAGGDRPPAAARPPSCTALAAACGVADLAADTSESLAVADAAERMLAHQLAVTHKLAMASMAHALNFTELMEKISRDDRHLARNARNEHAGMVERMLGQFRDSHLHLLRMREMAARLRGGDQPPAPLERKARRPSPA